MFTFVKVNFTNYLFTMVNSEEFTIRIQKILTFYSLSAAAFAEKMGIGRSSISHIISGRNKPSLEFVLHILDTFEEVSFDWLIYGKGTFPKSEKPTPTLESKNVNNSHNIKNGQQDIFLSTEENSENLNNLQNTSTIENTEKTIVTPIQKSPIDRIVIFYTNGSFSEYKN